VKTFFLLFSLLAPIPAFAADAPATLAPGMVNPGWYEPPAWFKESLLDIRDDVKEAASGTLHEQPWLMKAPPDLSKRDGRPLLVLFEQKVCAACDEMHAELRLLRWRGARGLPSGRLPAALRPRLLARLRRLRRVSEAAGVPALHRGARRAAAVARMVSPVV